MGASEWKEELGIGKKRYKSKHFLINAELNDINKYKQDYIENLVSWRDVKDKYRFKRKRRVHNQYVVKLKRRVHTGMCLFDDPKIQITEKLSFKTYN